jgi:hypothetical protein
VKVPGRKNKVTAAMVRMLVLSVQAKKRGDARASDLEFDPSHPKSSTLIQRMVRTKSRAMTVCFNEGYPSSSERLVNVLQESTCSEVNDA